MPPRQPDVVLLTATVVAPDDARNLARRDSALRLHDHLQAFDFYLKLLAGGSFGALVLCENSGFDLAPFAAKARQTGGQHQEALSSQRGMLLKAQVQHVQHMQMALTQMNIQLSKVISDVVGETGQKIAARDRRRPA